MLDLPLFTGRLAYFAQRLIACFSHYAYNDYGKMASGWRFAAVAPARPAAPWNNCRETPENVYKTAR
jgi:hypothetical protein